jgi:hypothetical protein
VKNDEDGSSDFAAAAHYFKVVPIKLLAYTCSTALSWETMHRGRVPKVIGTPV